MIIILLKRFKMGYLFGTWLGLVLIIKNRNVSGSGIYILGDGCTLPTAPYLLSRNLLRHELASSCGCSLPEITKHAEEPSYMNWSHNNHIVLLFFALYAVPKMCFCSRRSSILAWSTLSFVLSLNLILVYVLTINMNCHFHRISFIILCIPTPQ